MLDKFKLAFDERLVETQPGPRLRGDDLGSDVTWEFIRYPRGDWRWVVISSKGATVRECCGTFALLQDAIADALASGFHAKASHVVHYRDEPTLDRHSRPPGTG